MIHRSIALGTLCALALVIAQPSYATQATTPAKPRVAPRAKVVKPAANAQAKVTFEDVLISSAKAPNSNQRTTTSTNGGDTATHEAKPKAPSNYKEIDKATPVRSGSQPAQAPAVPGTEPKASYSFGATQTGSVVNDNAGQK